jgi:hypothetical protein
MKKSLIALAVSAAVALPGLAAAEGSIGGDARYRMHSKTEDIDGGTKNVDDASNSRVRVKVSGKTDGAYVKARFSTADGTSGGAHAMKSDYGWMGAELGPLTLEGGRIADSWGNRFRSWDEDWDGIQALFKAGMLDMAVWRATDVEGGAYDKNTADDADTISYGVDLTGQAGMGNFGVRVVSSTSEKGGADASGTEVDGYYNGKIGPGMLIASIVSQSGELNEDVDGDSPTGLYVHWIQNFGMITGEVGFVQTTNYFTADDHFTLFSTVGTSNDTAVMNFGGIDEAQVIAVKASMKFGGKTKGTIGYGMMTGKPVDGADQGKATAIDLVVTHKISKTTKLVASYGTIDLDEDLGDTKYTSMGARMETKF